LLIIVASSLTSDIDQTPLVDGRRKGSFVDYGKHASPEQVLMLALYCQLLHLPWYLAFQHSIAITA